MPKYYRPSGRFTPLGLLTALTIGLTGVLLLSWVYGYVMAWIPIVQISVLGVIGYGAGLGALTGFGLFKGKIRSVALALLVGLAVGCAAIYAGWVAWIFAMSNQEAFLFRPTDLRTAILLLGEDGVWSMSGTTPTGWFLFSFWIAEALIILYFVVSGSHKRLKDNAFCESCDCWMNPPEVLGAFVTDLSVSDVKRDLENERIDGLGRLKPLLDDSDRFTAAISESCPKCTTYHLLSFQDRIITTDKDGNHQVKSRPVMDRLSVSQVVVDELRRLGDETDDPDLEDEDDEEGDDLDS